MLAAPLMALLVASAPAPRPGASAAEPPRMGQAALAREVPRYPNGTEPIDVGQTIEAHGVPMNVKSFMTTDSPRKVLDYYEAFFKKSGLPMLGNGDMVMRFPYPSVTVLDESRDIDLSVIAIPSADHQTMVLLARADMRPLVQDLDRAEKERYGGLPAYPKAIEPSAVAFTDGELHRTQVTFETDDAPEQVLAFYAKAFPGPGEQDAAGSLHVSVADGAWRIAARRSGRAQRTVVTALHTSDPRADDPEAQP